jgi:hypothetical protein
MSQINGNDVPALALRLARHQATGYLSSKLVSRQMRSNKLSYRLI